MALNKTWSADSTNKRVFTENEISTGIVKDSIAYSNVLNGLFSMAQEQIDNLQRSATGWSHGKIYAKDDVVVVGVILNGEIVSLILKSLVDDNNYKPLVGKVTADISYNENFEYAVPVWTITNNDPMSVCNDYLNAEYWEIVDDIIKRELENEFKGDKAQIEQASANSLKIVDALGNPITSITNLGINTNIINVTRANLTEGVAINRFTMPARFVVVNPPDEAASNEIVTAEWVRGKISLEPFMRNWNGETSYPSDILCRSTPTLSGYDNIVFQLPISYEKFVNDYGRGGVTWIIRFKNAAGTPCYIKSYNWNSTVVEADLNYCRSSYAVPSELYMDSTWLTQSKGCFDAGSSILVGSLYGPEYAPNGSIICQTGNGYATARMGMTDSVDNGIYFCLPSLCRRGYYTTSDGETTATGFSNANVYVQFHKGFNPDQITYFSF